MEGITAGTATTSGFDGADWMVKYTGKLPNYYITKADVKKQGYNPILGNLSKVAPGKNVYQR